MGVRIEAPPDRDQQREETCPKFPNVLEKRELPKNVAEVELRDREG